MIQLFKCLFGFHEYKKLKKLSVSSDQIYCKACKKMFAMNNDVQILLPWNSDMEKFYLETNEIIKRLGLK